MNKRKVILIVLIVVALLSLTGTFLTQAAGIRGISRANKIALIRLDGGISESGDTGLLGTSGITPRLVQSYLSKASHDPAVKAVVLRINSPGGSAAASQEIAAMIKKFDKPVVVSMGDVAASGGYYISVYADRIVADPSTATGSIGVITQLFYIQGLLEKLGIQAETIKSGEHKDMFFRPLTEEERTILQDISNEVYEQFIAAVAEGRNLPVAQVRSLATGQIYTGARAKDLGLIDQLGDLQEAEKIAAELAHIQIQKIGIEEYGAPSFWQWLFGLTAQIKRSLSAQLSDPQLLLIKMLEGWQAVPRY